VVGVLSIVIWLFLWLSRPRSVVGSASVFLANTAESPSAKYSRYIWCEGVNCSPQYVYVICFVTVDYRTYGCERLG
jgi:hypothetical protein